MSSGSRNYSDERKTGEISVSKFRHISMAAPDPQQRRTVQGNPGHFKMNNLFIMFEVKRGEVELLFHDTIHRFPAADMLVLVAATHMSQATPGERFECHRCRIMITGEKIPALVGESLPALQPESLCAEIHGAAMYEKHSLVRPLHGHRIEYRQERGVTKLFVPVRARRITPADNDPVKKGVIMVAKYGDEAEFP